jgi:arsenite methyltransferase
MKLLEISKSYSELEASDECPSYEDFLNYKEAKPGEVCVEIGSGLVNDTLRLAEVVGKDGFVYAIDISDDIAEKVAGTEIHNGVSNVDFMKCVPEKITLKDKIADLVISNCTIIHASDKQSVWNEIYRVLKNGGRFIISDIYSVNSVPGEYKNEHKSITRDEYLNQLDKAGFSIIRILEESVPYSKDGILVSNWTIAGEKSLSECGWCD